MLRVARQRARCGTATITRKNHITPTCTDNAGLLQFISMTSNASLTEKRGVNGKKQRTSFGRAIRSTASKYSKYRYLMLLMTPGIAYYVIFHYLPMFGIQLAFKHFMVLKGIWRSPWAGLHYFKILFGYPSFWEVFRNTIIISVYKISVGFTMPIIFAILLNEIQHLPYKKVTQTLSYLPHFISWVVLGGLFRQFLSPSIGPINIAIKALGMRPIFFLGDPRWFRFTVVATSIWKGVGWGSIIYLATIAGIDPQLYEAAKIDGAGRFRRIAHITIPSLAPVITIMLIFAMRGIVLDDFDQIFNMYNPAVYRVGDVLSTYIYRVGLVNFEFSLSTAVNLFRNLLAFALIIAANAGAKRINEYGIW
jgi:putative aldouronate transport system permease protein